MNAVKCIVPNCKEEFRTLESVSPNVRFICKNHPCAVQVKANGRIFDSEKDTQDMNVHFQDTQFDHSLSRSSKGVVRLAEVDKSDAIEDVNAI